MSSLVELVYQKSGFHGYLTNEDLLLFPCISFPTCIFLAGRYDLVTP